MKVKICCISSVDEAMLAINAGATALGLVGPMPSGPGVIDDELAARIVQAVGAQAETFLLTSETTAAGVIAHHQRVGSSTIQLVDELPEGAHFMIKKQLSDVQLVQVIHVLDQTSVEQALAAAGHVDALLLDSGNPGLAVKELGGTGRVHDWALSLQIVQKAGIAVYLAGGLNPENVREAMGQVEPFGLDLCSGVRTNGDLDAVKLTDFMQQVFQ